LYKVDAQGAASEFGTLHAIAPEHFVVRGGPARIEGLTQGIPYFLQDARPAGFLGRAVPEAYPELALPARVQDWSDDHALIFLTQHGSDAVGNLILGAESVDRYLSGLMGRGSYRVRIVQPNIPHSRKPRCWAHRPHPLRTESTRSSVRASLEAPKPPTS
jgi:hypothetical protein